MHRPLAALLVCVKVKSEREGYECIGGRSEPLRDLFRCISDLLFAVCLPLRTP
jgi:hypothetical protein